MSRIGKRPVELPKGVSITAGADFFEVKGPKGSVRRAIPADVAITVAGTTATISAKPELDVASVSRVTGTVRSHLANAVAGVEKGYSQALKLEGTGYKVEELKNNKLTMTLGLSHKVIYDVPKAVSVVVTPDSKQTVVFFETADKDLLGQVVAQMQSFRPPEPYKGKGVRLVVMNEKAKTAQPELVKIVQKAGKAGKGGKK
ncbi:MAG: 50S ribosomal protein L6 [Polyangiales bacterium]